MQRKNKPYDCPFMPLNNSVYITEGKPMAETTLESGIVVANTDKAHGLNASRMGRIVAMSPDFHTGDTVSGIPNGRLGLGDIVLYDPTSGRPRTYVDREGKLVELRRLGAKEIEAVVQPSWENDFAAQVDGEEQGKD